MAGFAKELMNLLNKHSMENESNTPDFLLADYIQRCLDNWNTTLNDREVWFGRKEG